MKEKRLKRLIKTMYLLREVINEKKDSDRIFKGKNKHQMINEISELIDLSLEEFYACRTPL